ncbi:MAG: ATP-binding protein, partial [Proteobacteria bacterium]|nr:ATP-binding protein [Pseudomonadota bacterium]
AHEKGQDLGWMDAREGEPDDTAEPGQDCGRPLVPVRANAPELHEVLANLVHNAIVHTPRGGRITVRVSTAGASAQAEVSDDGPGIEAGRRDEVFGRFRQAGSAAASRNSGSGLGLAIARAYARRNGGDIVLADPDPGTSGLRAILRLPLAS